jgi:hypothetical protein
MVVELANINQVVVITNCPAEVLISYPNEQQPGPAGKVA